MRVLLALLGILALLANATPGKPQDASAFLTDVDFVYDVTQSSYAVIPGLDRDTRSRVHPAVPASDGKTPLFLVLPFPPSAGGTLAGAALPPAGAPPRFAHLEQRTSPSRAPPTRV